MKTENMTTQELRQQIAFYEKQLAERERKQELAATKPLRDSIASMQEGLCAEGAWPKATLVCFDQGNKHYHAHETYYCFETVRMYKHESSAASWGNLNHFSVRDGFIKSPLREDGPRKWLKFLQTGKSDSKNFFKVFADRFKPNQYVCWWSRFYGEEVAAKVFFFNRLVCCPLCGEIDGKSEFSSAAEQVDCISYYSGSSNGPQGDCVKRDSYSLRCMMNTAKAIQEHLFFESGLIFRRCKECIKHRHSFVSIWKSRLQIWRNSYLKHNEQDIDGVTQQLAKIWPDHFAGQNKIKQSIFRQAKKRARIKPLSRGELAFFSMHLAATQMKELKALLNK